MFERESIDMLMSKTVQESKIQPTINEMIHNIRKQKEDLIQMNQFLNRNKFKRKNTQSNNLIEFRKRQQ
jgi:hypothetical protein